MKWLGTKNIGMLLVAIWLIASFVHIISIQGAGLFWPRSPSRLVCCSCLVGNARLTEAGAEAELIWPEILHDAAAGELQPVYGREQRWQKEIEVPIVIPPSRKELGRYANRQ